MGPTKFKSQTLFLENPLDRCLNIGAHSLSLRECLSILISEDLAENKAELDSLFNTAELDQNAHAILRIYQLVMKDEFNPHFQKLSPLPRARLKASFEMAKRLVEAIHQPAPKSQIIEVATRGHAMLKISPEWRLKSHEWLGFVPVLSDRTLGPFSLIEKGVRTHVNTDPQMIFSKILSFNPLGFYLFHNHPSGSLVSSKNDYDLTDRIIQTSTLLEIEFLGHAIITFSSSRWIV